MDVINYHSIFPSSYHLSETFLYFLSARVGDNDFIQLLQLLHKRIIRVNKRRFYEAARPASERRMANILLAGFGGV